MDTPSRPRIGAKVRSWLAGSTALLLLGLGQSVVAPWAAAEETPEPTPSTSTQEEPAPAETEKAKPSESAEPKESPEPKQSAEPSRSAKPEPAPEPTKSATPSRSATAKPAPKVAAVPNATAAREGARFTTPDGAEFWVPAQWQVGKDLVISGAGWRAIAGDAGSIIAVKLDGGAVKTKEAVRHPVTGDVQANKTIYAVVQADADGEWTLRLPYPSAANSDADWSAGQTHAINLLTGSMLDGDVIRSGPGTTTVTAAPAPDPDPTDPKPDPDPVDPPNPNPDPTDPNPNDPDPNDPDPTPTCVAAPAKVDVSPSAVDLGGVLRVTGSGFCHPAEGGSVIAVKLDDGAYSRLDASVHANKTVWAIIPAGADGSFDVQLQLPDGTDAGTNGSTPGLTTGEHALRLLTGSFKTVGDVKDEVRSLAVPFSINSATEPTPTPTCDATQTAAVNLPSTSAQLGGTLRVTGTGFCHPTDGGSVIGVKIDDGGLSRLDTSVHANKTIWAIVNATPDGSFDVEIPLPDGTTSGPDGSNPAFTSGAHTLRFLTGSLKTGDTVRSVPADFTVTGDGPTDPATQPPTWAHDTLTVGGATAWVQSEVDTASGSTIKIKGTGWTNQAGTGASTVALKLNHAGGQYARTGGGIVAPTGVADPTIWKLLAPSGTAAHPNVIAVPASGNFEIEIDAPEGLRAGQLLTAQFLSGRFGANDTVRNVTTKPLVVGGVPYIEQPDDDDVTCTATSATPVVTIAEPRASLGSTLHVTGAGFCHPGEKRGGSTIAIKIDEGNVSRLNDSLHSNRTIWTIVRAKGSDGTFDIELQLPDGTTKGVNGSSPAFKEGAHTLRLLTGSLKDGDASRTVLSPEFVVGKYRPTGVPEPVEATEDLTSAARNGVQASRTAKALTVTVPGAKAGDWIYLNTYSGGSPTDPWGAAWFRAGAGGRVKASLTGVTLPIGTSKLSVQSGNEGEVGKLLGWTPITVAGEKANETPSDTTTRIRTIVRTVTTTTTSASDDSSPTKVPNAPVERASQLTGLSNGDATAKVDGTKLTVTLPKGAAGQWVYVYLYSGASIAKAGWVQLTDAKAFSVDLKGLADGRHRVVAVNADGGIVGWVEASKGNVTTAAPTVGNPQAPAGPVTPADQGTAALTQPGAGSMEPVLIGAAVAVLAAGLVGLRRLAKPKGVA